MFSLRISFRQSDNYPLLGDKTEELRSIWSLFLFLGALNSYSGQCTGLSFKSPHTFKILKTHQLCRLGIHWWQYLRAAQPVAAHWTWLRRGLSLVEKPMERRGTNRMLWTLFLTVEMLYKLLNSWPCLNAKQLSSPCWQVLFTSLKKYYTKCMRLQILQDYDCQ